MKTYLLLIMLICFTLQTQTTFSQTSGNQLDYYTYNLNDYDLKDEYNNLISRSPYPDTIIVNGGTGDNYFGISVSTAGDVNGDGYSDIIVGAHGYTGSFGGYTGRAYIYYGGTSMDNIADLTMTGEGENNRFGLSVSSAGDVNGDGYSDVIVGAPINSGHSAGKAYIYFGGIVMDNIVDIVLFGQSNYDNFGYSVSTAGDVNRDGYSDVIVGAQYSNSLAGRAYIYYGGSSMNNVADVTMTEASTGYFGISVSSAGDVNGDGFSDVIVGAEGSIRAYVYFGKL